MSIEPEYSITESLDTVTIQCIFSGRSANQCSLSVADLYAKFNLHPYFLIIDFPKFVSTENVLATANKNTLTVRIKKMEPEKWPSQPWKLEDKEQLAKQRNDSLQRLLDSERARSEAERNQREEDKKTARQRAWDLDKQAREALKEAKED